MRAQGKGVSEFPANPLRARILAREFERKCLEARPPLSEGKYNRHDHINKYTSTFKDAKKRFDVPRNPFFNWRKGKALPSSTTTDLMGGLFGEDLTGKWRSRGVDSPEQTFLCALDLISRNNQPNCSEVLKEADEILGAVSSAVCALIPRIPNLERPKFTSYRGSKSLASSVNRKSSRYVEWSKKRPVAYPFIAERINPYDSVSPLCASLMYLVKPNNQTHLPYGLAQALLLDVISGVIAAYIVMLHRNPSELQTGGLVVDLYRLVHRLFLAETDVSAKGAELVREVFYNRFPEFSVEADELIARLGGLIELFQGFIEKSGLFSTEFAALIDPVNPDRSADISQWWCV
ncbi:hypothetical protein [Pleionea litopenaei]|uniref:Uncharacterized protein n=1 Tax=Pleionea litopenaei TaxID=3070815 RepID=A0AA51RQC8_9GAMM|nr:hypothetical protein [Pleionea sp. HL-JVS1]WMS85604.1 hypothetical protein Q9312_10305 [Pleionea sp. HL-JVS1]